MKKGKSWNHWGFSLCHSAFPTPSLFPYFLTFVCIYQFISSANLSMWLQNLLCVCQSFATEPLLSEIPVSQSEWVPKSICNQPHPSPLWIQAGFDSNKTHVATASVRAPVFILLSSTFSPVLGSTPQLGHTTGHHWPFPSCVRPSTL